MIFGCAKMAFSRLRQYNSLLPIIQVDIRCFSNQSIEDLKNGILEGNRVALSQSITLGLEIRVSITM